MTSTHNKTHRWIKIALLPIGYALILFVTMLFKVAVDTNLKLRHLTFAPRVYIVVAGVTFLFNYIYFLYLQKHPAQSARLSILIILHIPLSVIFLMLEVAIIMSQIDID
jgi:heme/copper-type cytochrome/quinol oxidase subunit 4